MIRLTLALIAAALALTACPPPVSAPPPLSIDTLEVSPSAVPIAGASVRLSWSTTGAAQARFGDEIVPTSGEKIAFATPGQLFTLTAVGDNRVVTSDLVIGHVPGEPVNGTVVDREGQPLAGAEVKIGPLTATTDSAGRFTISDAPRPYSARVSEKNSVVMNFIGLTTDEPVLWTDHFGSAPASQSASLQTTVSGWADGGMDTIRAVVAVGRESLASEILTPNGREVRLQWRADAGGDFVLFAYQYQVRHPDQPRYLAAAEPVRLNVDAGEVRAVPLSVAEPQVGIARANVSLPSWASFAIVGEHVMMPGFATLRLDSVSRTAGTIAAELPAWDAGTFHFSLLATRDPGGACEPYLSVRAFTEAVALDGGTLDVELGEAPMPQPCDGDSVPRSSSLTWNYRPGALCEVKVFTNFPSASENYFTVGSSLPLSALPYPEFATQYGWAVDCYPDFTSVEDSLSPAFRGVRSHNRPGRSASASDLMFTVQ